MVLQIGMLWRMDKEKRTFSAGEAIIRYTHKHRLVAETIHLNRQTLLEIMAEGVWKFGFIPNEEKQPVFVGLVNLNNVPIQVFIDKTVQDDHLWIGVVR